MLWFSIGNFGYSETLVAAPPRLAAACANEGYATRTMFAGFAPGATIHRGGLNLHACFSLASQQAPGTKP
jgi:hypothetical protein